MNFMCMSPCAQTRLTKIVEHFSPLSFHRWQRCMGISVETCNGSNQPVGGTEGTQEDNKTSNCRQRTQFKFVCGTGQDASVEFSRWFRHQNTLCEGQDCGMQLCSHNDMGCCQQCQFQKRLDQNHLPWS